MDTDKLYINYLKLKEVIEIIQVETQDADIEKLCADILEECER